MQAWENHGDFRAAIEGDSRVREKLSLEQIAASFSLERQLGHVKAIYDRVFGD
jgi:hypothetical protein